MCFLLYQGGVSGANILVQPRLSCSDETSRILVEKGLRGEGRHTVGASPPPRVWSLFSRLSGNFGMIHGSLQAQHLVAASAIVQAGN